MRAKAAHLIDLPASYSNAEIFLNPNEVASTPFSSTTATDLPEKIDSAESDFWCLLERKIGSANPGIALAIEGSRRARDTDEKESLRSLYSASNCTFSAIQIGDVFPIS
jgi:hypothetical protein